LILGETGTGKSSLAHYIHSRSSVSDGPFVEYHCDAVSPAQMAAEVFGTGTRDEEKPDPAIERARGGTLLISEFQDGADVLYPYVESHFELAKGPSLGLVRQKAPGYRLIISANQNIRSQLSQSVWRRLTQWPPVLLTPLRMQRRRKWKLFQYFVEAFANHAGHDIPVTIDFLLYFFVVSYGWPGNAGQVRGFAEYLCQAMFSDERELKLDDEFRSFDETDAFVISDGVAPTQSKADHLLYRNRIQRDFMDIIRYLQTADVGPEWRDLAKATPGRGGRWQYPMIRWNDPYFDSAETCARCGQKYALALAQVGDWAEQTPLASLRYKATSIPWHTKTRSRMLAPGHSEVDLARLVAYGLLTGDIQDKDMFLKEVYAAMISQAPGKTQREYQEMGIPRARLKELM
jgi:hypothetical protein